MKKAVGIGVSNFEFFNILLSYYPKDLNEDFAFYLFVDTNKLSIDHVKRLVKTHDIPVFNNAEYLSIPEMYEFYEKELGLTGKAKAVLYDHGCMFKLLMPDYLHRIYGADQIYSSDDDVFILGDLTDTFANYKGFGFKKDNLFNFKTDRKYEFLAAFNEMFESEFKMERINGLSLNAGNIMSRYHPKLIHFFERFINHSMTHHMFFDFTGYTRWTMEQRFHHFWMHWLMDEGKYPVDFLKAEDLRLVLSIGKNHPDQYFKNKTPRLIHYAVGKKKHLFLAEFLPRIEWKYGFIYQPKYEMKNKLFCESAKLF
jgi:hypothetical protein